MRHFTFSLSAAGSMRQALASVGRNERVFGLDDSLATGPINPPSTANRAAWWEKTLGVEDWLVEAATDSEESFWHEATSGAPDRVIWVCRKSASEYCGFLELISRLGDAPYLVVDATDEQFAYSGMSTTKHYFILGLGELAPEAFLRNQLFDKARPLTSGEFEAYRATWQRLRAENSPFRIVTEAGLVSAPLDHFDAGLLSHVTPEWQGLLRVIGNMLVDAIDRGFANEDTEVLAARLRALARAGRIALRGAGKDFVDLQVRLPA